MDEVNLREKLRHFLDADLRLTAFPSKRKMKIYAMAYLAKAFEGGKTYTEKETNELIGRRTAFRDPATVRREMYDYHFLSREKDGSRYWLESERPNLPDFDWTL